MKLIDKEILLLKINSKIEEAQKVFNVAPSSVIGGMIEGYTRTKKIVSSLEVKEVDLEKEIDNYIYTNNGRQRLALELDWKCCNLTLKGGDAIIKFAKHFFELGLKAQKGE